MIKRQRFIVRDGALAQRVRQVVAELNLEKPWKVTIEPYSPKRSLQANALMWSWFTIIGDHIGDSKEAVHDAVVPELAESTHTMNGHPQWSTKRMTTAQMAAFLDKLHQWAFSFHGIHLPLPEEMHLKDMPK